MAEEEAKKVEVEVAQEPEAAPAPAAEPAKEDVAEEKAVIPATEPPAADSKALAIVESKYYLLSSVAHQPPLSLSGTGRLAMMERWRVVVYWSVPRVLGIVRNFLPLYAWFVVSVLSGSCTVAVLSTCDP